jgi:hypothetical protein
MEFLPFLSDCVPLDETPRPREDLMLLKSTLPLVLAMAVLGTAPIAHGQDLPDGPG